MKTTHLVLLSVCLAFVGIDALRLEKRDDPAVVKIPLQRKTSQPLPKPRKRRRGTVQTPDENWNDNLLYIVQLEIGTPPQSTFVQLDTGSSDLVIETPNSNLCTTAAPNPCTNFGAYTANASSTYEYIDSNFFAAYGGGDGAIGDWASDIVGIGGANLLDTQFGIMYQSTVLEGILGVSYQAIEARQTFSGEPQYDNFPVLLVKQGYIASRAYSLYTNDDRTTGGVLLFGGVDTSKFSGELVTIDLIASGFDELPGVVDFTISLLSVTGTDASGNPAAFTNGTTPINVVMDSGSTITQLPQDLATSIWTFVGATPYPGDPSLAYIPCSMGSSTETINFGFKGITIVVPMSQMVIFPDNNGEYCIFGIQIGDPGSFVIGDTTLTAMYLVYDLDNYQISLAPAVFGSTTENILQILAGPNGVPDTISSSSSGSGSRSKTSTSSSQTTTSKNTISSSSKASSPSASPSTSFSQIPTLRSTTSSSSKTSSSTTSPSLSFSRITTSKSTTLSSSRTSSSSALPSTSSSQITTSKSTTLSSSTTSSSSSLPSTSSSQTTTLKSTTSSSSRTSSSSALPSTSSSQITTSKSTTLSSSTTSSSSALPSTSSSQTTTLKSTTSSSSRTSSSSALPSTSSSQTSTLKSTTLSSSKTSSSSAVPSIYPSQILASMSTTSSSSKTSSSSATKISTSTSTSLMVSAPTTTTKPFLCILGICLDFLEYATDTLSTTTPSTTPTSTTTLSTLILPTTIISTTTPPTTTLSTNTRSTTTPSTTPTSTTILPTTTISTTIFSTTTLCTTTGQSSATTLNSLSCHWDLCLEAVEIAGITHFCSAFISDIPIQVPIGVAIGCSRSTSRISSACECLPTSV